MLIMEKSFNYANIEIKSGKVTNVGGLIGNTTSGSLVKKSGNNGNIIASASEIGGVIAMASSGGVVNDVYNKGNITNIFDNGRVFGISSSIVNDSESKVMNIYNIGNLECKGYVVLGISQNIPGGSKNIYNAGKTTLLEGTTNGKIYEISNSMNVSEITNIYYIDSPGSKGPIGDGKTYDMNKTSEELKAMAPVLGSGFKADTKNINKGYPILAWE